MATREAGIKLTLNSSTLIAGLDGLGAHAKATGKKIKSGLSAGFDGVGKEFLKGGRGALDGIGSGLKNAIGSAATLGGGIGFGMLLKKASDLREKVRDIEFQINKTGRATTSWQEVLKTTQDAASATGKSSEEMANIYESLFASTGDADFAAKALIPIGHAAQASGKDVTQLANAAQMLQRKFGATAETLPDMLTAFVEKTDSGGLSLDALGNKFALMAGEAAEAGFTGKDGLNQLLGMMTQLDSRVGEKSEPAMKKLFQTLKDGSKDLKAFSKESGLKFTPDMSAMEKIRKVMGSEKGRAKMAEKLGGESRVVFDELSKPFDAAFAQAKASGAKTKDATEAGLVAWDKAMADMGKATIDYKKIVAESEQGQLEDPQVRLNAAIEKISQKFTEPPMLAALDKLADSLPRVAGGMIKLLDFALNSPLLAGASIVGAKVGGSALGAGMSKLGENAAAGLSNVGVKIGRDIKDEFASGAMSWGKAAGAAVGIAGAAAIAFEIGKSLIDARIAEKEESQKQTSSAVVEAANAGNDPVKLRAAADRLTADYVRQKEAMRDAGPTDAIFNGLAGLVDSDYKAGELVQAEATLKALTQVNEQLEALAKHTKAAAGGAAELAGGAKKAGQAASAAAGYFGNVSGSPSDSTGNGTSKGPPAPGAAKPGYLF